MHSNSHLSYCSRCSLRLRSTAPYLNPLLHHQCLENCWGEALQLSSAGSSRLRLKASHLNCHWYLTQTLRHRICSVTLWPESANNNQSWVWYPVTQPNEIERNRMLCSPQHPKINSFCTSNTCKTGQNMQSWQQITAIYSYRRSLLKISYRNTDSTTWCFHSPNKISLLCRAFLKWHLSYSTWPAVF